MVVRVRVLEGIVFPVDGVRIDVPFALRFGLPLTGLHLFPGEPLLVLGRFGTGPLLCELDIASVSVVSRSSVFSVTPRAGTRGRRKDVGIVTVGVSGISVRPLRYSRN